MLIDEQITRFNCFSLVRKRIAILFLFIVLAYLAIGLRLLELSATTYTVIQPKPTAAVHRGDILDRNGMVLATNITTASLYAQAKQLTNPTEVANMLGDTLPNLNMTKIKEKFDLQRYFVWIKRHLSPAEQQKIHNLGIPGLYMIEDQLRLYPQGNLFSHVIGYLDVDGNGLSGIELSMDGLLKNANHSTPNNPSCSDQTAGVANASLEVDGQAKAPVNSSDKITLSLDSRIQQIVHNTIMAAVKNNQAIGGVGIVTNVETGEIISLVNYPDFNPHTVSQEKAPNIFNHASLGLQEMGSTFKILTIATALDMGILNINDAFNVSMPLKINNFTIHDYKGKGGWLSVPEILMYSSNIGTAQIGQKIGAHKQREYLKKFGLLEKMKLEIPEVSKPLFPNEKRWSNEIYISTISFGHGAAVTPLHTIKAFAAVVNGGKLVPLTLLKKDQDSFSNNDQEYQQIITPSTSKKMRSLLYLIAKYGSAKKANVPEYLVGGKTGTAEKVSASGGYSKEKNLASFIGAFPMHKPKYALFVAIDEPKKNTHNSFMATGGAVAAPIAGEIIGKIAKILAVESVPLNDSDVEQVMHIQYTPRYQR